MRWIGQHIYDFVSRFGNDVYIDNGSTSINSTISGAAALLNLTSASDQNGPIVTIKNTKEANTGGTLQFLKFRPSSVGAAGDDIGTINFNSEDDDGSSLTYVSILGEISDPTDGSPEGKISILARHHSSFGNVITGEGNGDGVVDVSLALGASSTTTIAGDLSVTTGLILDSVDITTVQTSAESFADNDTSLMTSAAIDDRIVAATSSTFVDLTSEVSGTLPVANGGTGATSLADNSILTGTGTSAITAEANLTWDASMLTVSSTGDAGEPIIKIHQTQDAVPTTGGELRFDTDRGAGLVGNADDVIGTITWRGHDTQTGGSAAETIYASVVGLIQDPTNTHEDGKLEFNVLNQNVSNTGLLISPSGVNGHVNATIGKGTVGIVTIEGSLNLGGHSVNDIDITSEASDANDHLMTALAIKNRIEDYNYVTAAATLTTAAQPNITTMTGFLGGTANALVTDDGDGTVTSEAGLTYDSEILTIGDDDNGTATIKRKTHSDEAGGMLQISGGDATGTNKGGGTTFITGGLGTGTGGGGLVRISTANADSSGSSANSLAWNWDFKNDGVFQTTTVGYGITEFINFHTNTFESVLSDGDQVAGKRLIYSPGANDVLADGQIFFLHTDGTWDQADASSTSTGASQLLCVGNSAARVSGVILDGFVRIPSTEILNTPGSGAVDGLPLYVSTTAGHFDFTAPSGNNEYVRVVGYAIDDDSSDVLVYFNPDSTHVKITA